MERSPSKEEEYQQLKGQYSNFDIRRIYEFEQVLGQGSFGVVRRACLKKKKVMKFAIKTIPKEIIKDVAMLSQELEILKETDHPNIVKLHEIYVDKDMVHIVTELCTGGELFKKILKEVKFTEHKAKGVMEQIMGAVKHLHSKGIIHRDLKPENFLFSDGSETGVLKLIDFGLSIRIEKETLTLKKAHSVGGPAKKDIKLVGTPYYMAPEIIKKE